MLKYPLAEVSNETEYENETIRQVLDFTFVDITINISGQMNRKDKIVRIKNK